MKASLVVLLIALLIVLGAAPEVLAKAPHNRCVFMFFDLGNTLVDTTERDKKDDISRISYFPDTQEYLGALQSRGFELGLVVNVPGDWGLDGLQSYVDERWKDESASRFAWSIFGSNILTPDSDKHRKPHPHMFCQAVKIAEAQGCVAVFQGEDFMLPIEKRLAIIQSARDAGMVSVLINKANAPRLIRNELAGFLPVDQVENYIRANPPTKKPGFCAN